MSLLHPVFELRLRMALLLALAFGVPLGAARPTWVEVRSPHFVAYSEAGESEARSALEGFEGLRTVFLRIFPVLRVDPPRPMVILVLKNEASMKRLMPSAFERPNSSRLAGLFMAGEDRNYALLRVDVDHEDDRAYDVLFHEYTHCLIHQNLGRVPTWLDEGIAEFYGATEIHTRQVYCGRVHRGRLQFLRSVGLLPIETLLSVTQDSPYYRERDKTGIFYAESWAFVHYLFMDPQAQKQGLLQAYLKAAEATPDPVAAARQAFGDLTKLKETLYAYCRQGRFNYRTYDLEVALSDKGFAARPLDEAETLVLQAEFKQRSGQKDDLELLAQAETLGTHRPEVAAAQGYGLFRRGEYEAARKAFQRALDLGSQDFRPPYYLARMAQLSLGGPADPKAILAWLAAANRLCPDFPGIHQSLCYQYSIDPQDPEKALQEGRTALTLDPQDLGLRANVGIACLNLRREAEARAISAELNRLAYTREERLLANHFAAQVEQAFRKRPELLRGSDVQLAVPDATPPPAPARPVKPLRFRLSSHLVDLGYEVQQLVAAGQVQEAIRKVKRALAKADNDYDRKSLKSLLQQLEARL